MEGAQAYPAPLYNIAMIDEWDQALTNGSKQHKTEETVRQVRDNQRRSRARRKELLEDMQRRLSEYERLGVQATLEMQQAARAVAKENERLRLLLSRVGVSDAAVEEFVRVGGPVDDKPAQRRRTSKKTAGSKELPELQQTRHQNTSRVSSVTALLNEEQPATPACNSRREPRFSASPSNDERLPAMPDKDDTETSSAVPLMSHPVDAQLGHDSGMETPCDVAATILASAQGHEDTSRARVVLGCKGPNACVVKNLRIFDLLDEAG